MKKTLISLSIALALFSITPLSSYAKGEHFHVSPETEVQSSAVKIHEVQAVYYAWTKALIAAKGNPTNIVKLYAPDAILLPTLSDEIKFNNEGQLAPYFKTLTSNDQLSVKPQRLKTFVSGDVAVNTGTYTFSYMSADHKLVELPARFTFVYKLSGEKTWLIITHHSSVLPAAPGK